MLAGPTSAFRPLAPFVIVIVCGQLQGCIVDDGLSIPEVTLRNDPFAYICSSAPPASFSTPVPRHQGHFLLHLSFFPSFFSLATFVVSEVNRTSLSVNRPWRTTTRRATWRTSTKGEHYPIVANRGHEIDADLIVVLTSMMKKLLVDMTLVNNP